MAPTVLIAAALLGLSWLETGARPLASAQDGEPSVLLQVVSYPGSGVEHEFMWPRPWFTLYANGTVIRADISEGVAGRTESADYYGMTTGRLPVAEAEALVEQVADDSSFFSIKPEQQQDCDPPLAHDTSYVLLRHQARERTIWIDGSNQVVEEPCRSKEPGRAILVEWMRQLDDLAIQDQQPYQPSSADVIVYRQSAGPVPTQLTPPPVWSAFPGTDRMPLIGAGHGIFVWPVDGAMAALAYDAVRTTTPESSMQWMRDPRSGLDVRLGVRPLPPNWDAWADAVEREWATLGTPYTTPRPRVSPTPGYRYRTPAPRPWPVWLPLLVRGR